MSTDREHDSADDASYSVQDPDEAGDRARRVLDRIGQSVPGFVARQGQIDMTQVIARGLSQVAALDEDDDGNPKANPASEVSHPVVVVEAGTGTGKSLGYLSGVIEQARRTGAKIMLSTGTVALQEQLVHRDIPMFLEHSDIEAKVSLAKGRGRYACPVKMKRGAGVAEDDGSQQSLPGVAQTPSAADPATRRQVEAMHEAFTTQKWSGDLDEWPHALSGDVRKNATINATSCMKSQCPMYDKCPFYAARADLKKADIVVSNHHLTLADIRLTDGQITGCPPGRTIYVMDEAHHIVDTAKKFLERKISTAKGLALLSGAFPKLEEIAGYLPALHKDEYDREQTRADAQTANDAMRALRDQLRSGARDHEPGDILRFERGHLNQTLRTAVSDLHVSVQDLKKRVEAVGEALSDREEALSTIDASLAKEHYGELKEGLDEVRDAAFLMGWEDKKNIIPFARWIDFDREQEHEDYRLHIAPTRVGHSLRKLIWDQAAGVVLTSATLSSLGTFDKFARDTGLGRHADAEFFHAQSPFNYADNAELSVASMDHIPAGSDVTRFNAEIAQRIPDLVSQESGGSLVLFTSRAAMHEVLNDLPPRTRERVLVQGEQSKKAMLETHRARVENGEQSMLFGLNGLAEGLDLPGDLCRHVIITRLSFQPPNDPVNKTIEEYLKDRGKSSFSEIMLPEASRKLVQSTGRLLRTEQDQGRITIMDRRLVTKGYGAKMIADLPPYPVRDEAAAPRPESRPIDATNARQTTETALEADDAERDYAKTRKNAAQGAPLNSAPTGLF